MPLQILAYFSFLDWSLLAKELLFSADISISPPVEEATRSTEQNKSPFLFRAKNKKGKEKERIPFPGVTEKMNVLPELKKPCAESQPFQTNISLFPPIVFIAKRVSYTASLACPCIHNIQL